MSLVLVGSALIFFSFLGYWRQNPLPFMLAAGASIMLGLEWFDVYGTSTGLSISLLLIAYCFVCFGYAFRLIFWKDRGMD